MADSGSDVLFVVPPFASVRCPAIGASLLTAACRRDGLQASIHYSNLLFADMIGVELHERIAFSSLGLMLGELLFRHCAFPGAFRGTAAGVAADFRQRNGHERIRTDWGEPISQLEIEQVSHHVDDFCGRAVSEIIERDPDVVGFSIMFQQTNAALALASALREARPAVAIVAGGPAMAGEMGETIAAANSAFDLVVSGECDAEIGRVIRSASHGEERNIGQAGYCSLDPIVELDDLPIPDFSDYLQQRDAASQSTRQFVEKEMFVPFESSRGCWWGQKNHCTFCGLNAEGMRFREKSPDRLISEIDQLAEQCGMRRLQCVDNIMPRSFFGGLLQDLARREPRYDIFYEVKSNFKEAELDLLVRAGVKTIQPGIESLSVDALKAIRKGVTGLQNIWLLRECLSRGMSVIWNMLVDIPGDAAKWYEDMLDVVPSIVHLPPPSGTAEIVIDRFSPYFSEPQAFGIETVRPLQAYARLFPSGWELSRTAYHFEGDYLSAWRADPDLRKRFGAVIGTWVAGWENDQRRPKLYCADLGDGRYFIEDTRRPDAAQRYALEKRESETLAWLTTARKCEAAVSKPGIERLIDLELVISLEGSLMSVVVDPSKWVELENCSRQAASGK